MVKIFKSGGTPLVICDGFLSDVLLWKRSLPASYLVPWFITQSIIKKLVLDLIQLFEV